jgi:hypothetical protein
VISDVLGALSWVQRDSTLLKILDGVAVAIAIVYAVIYLKEKAGPARPRLVRSAAISAIGLTCFAIFLFIRVFVIHD